MKRTNLYSGIAPLTIELRYLQVCDVLTNSRETLVFVFYNN